MTLEEIKDQYADDMGYDNWQQFKYKVLKYDGEEQAEKVINQIAKRYAKSKLEEAAEKVFNPEIDRDDMYLYLTKGAYSNGYDSACKTNSKSILEMPLD